MLGRQRCQNGSIWLKAETVLNSKKKQNILSVCQQDQASMHQVNTDDCNERALCFSSPSQHSFRGHKSQMLVCH